MYHCDGECVPLADDIPCDRHIIEYHSNSTGMFHRCGLTSNGICINDLGNCLSQAKTEVLLAEYCNYRVSKSFRQPSHIKCEGKKNWLIHCTTLVVLRSQIFLYNTTTNPSEYVIICVCINCVEFIKGPINLY